MNKYKFQKNKTSKHKELKKKRRIKKNDINLKISSENRTSK